MKKIDSINIIPFIDIMLVLFTIVLMSATFIQNHALDISLPQSKEGRVDKAVEAVLISIDKEGRIYFDEEEVEEKSLKERVKEIKSDSEISIRADKGSEFGKFVLLLDLLKERGLENISIITKKDQKSAT